MIKSVSAKFFFPLFLVICFLSLSAVSQFAYDRHLKNTRRRATENFLPLPSAGFFEKASFGFKNLLADLLWLDAIQFSTYWDYENLRFPQYFEIIPKLDPKFEFPYLFAIFLLPDKNFINQDGDPKPGWLDKKREIAETGIRNLPESWKIPFYFGVEEHIATKDYLDAAQYIKIASERKSAPPIVPATYAAYIIKSGDKKAGQALLAAMYQSATDDFTKGFSETWIYRLKIVGGVQAAVRNFKNNFGRYPETVDELVQKGYYPDDPELNNLYLLIDEHGEVRIGK